VLYKYSSFPFLPFLSIVNQMFVTCRMLANARRNVCPSRLLMGFVSVNPENSTGMISWLVGILMSPITVCGSGFGMLLLGETQKKHPGDLPPTVPDLPSPPPQVRYISLTTASIDTYLKCSHHKISSTTCTCVQYPCQLQALM